MKAEMPGFQPAHGYLMGTRGGSMVLAKATSNSPSPWGKLE